MNQNISIEEIMRIAVTYDGKDVRRINHFLKVYSFAKMIGEGEHLNEKQQYILEAAALLHDIGIHEAEKIYQSCAGNYQEELGPNVAKSLLAPYMVEKEALDRIYFLIGHHHTYDQVDGIDYQILIEADFFVNAFEDEMDETAMRKVYEKIFKTKTGKQLFTKMYLNKDK